MFSLNYAYTAYGVWYDEKLLDDKGWQYPKTWDEMIALCKTIKAAGIAPWTYQGKHPRYMSWLILSAAAKMAGPEVLLAIDNLEPNAWKHEAIKAAAEAYSQLAVDGYILPGSEGLDHIQSQTEWSQGKAVFISCGSWLESEQKKVTPPAFRMAVAPTPSLSTGDKLPFEALRGTAGEPYIVPAKAKNANGGMELMRIMLSKKGASDFTRKTSSLTCVAGAEEGVELPPGLTSVTKALKASGDKGFNWVCNSFYRRLERNLVDAACGDLFTKRINAAAVRGRVPEGRRRDRQGHVDHEVQAELTHAARSAPVRVHVPRTATGAVRRVRHLAVSAGVPDLADQLAGPVADLRIRRGRRTSAGSCRTTTCGTR